MDKNVKDLAWKKKEKRGKKHSSFLMLFIILILPCYSTIPDNSIPKLVLLQGALF